MDNLNDRPFISAPILSGIDETPSMLVPSLYGQSSMYSDNPAYMQADNLESLYPSIYHELYPVVADAADKMINAGYAPTPDTISALVDNVIKNSGLWYEDDDEDGFEMNQEAIPVQTGFGQRPYSRRRRRHHNRNTLRDIVRILLLRELFSRRR